MTTFTIHNWKLQQPEAGIQKSFDHYQSLYIEYLNIFRKLETAYDNIVHPQKREDIRKTLVRHSFQPCSAWSLPSTFSFGFLMYFCSHTARLPQSQDIVMTRVVQLKHELVLWNPAHAVHNPNIKEKLKDNMPFPWEYVHLDEILRAFKYPPETLEVPVPHYVSDSSRHVEFAETMQISV